MESGFIKSYDNSSIHYYEWNDVKNPIGVVQIFHGMADNAKRYDEIAKQLNKEGFIVFADDHRGHGLTVKRQDLGKYSGNNIMLDTIKDEIFFSRMLKKKYNLPLYVWGHSYGSFICQGYMTQTDLYDKAIICASALMRRRIDVKFGLLVASILKRFKPDAPAKFIEKVNYGSYFRKIKNGHWLSRDELELKKFAEDPLAGQALSNNFYYGMFSGFKYIYKKKALNNISKTKPIFIIAGSKDTVGSMGKSVEKLFKLYQKLGLNVSLKIYKDGRHEFFNEPQLKKQSRKDIINFLKRDR